MVKRYDPNTVHDDPPQPKEPVQTLNKTRVVDGVRWVAGVGKKDTDLVFIGTSLTEEEDEEEVQESYRQVRIPARYLKHSGGETFKRVALLYGIDIEECYYTTVCKWLLPHARRISPSTIDIELGIPCLIKELHEIKPKIVVAMGKCVLDFLIEEKVPKTDVEGVWFFSKKFNCKVYYMEPPIFLDMKPETVERFKTDFEAVAKELEQTRSGIISPSVKLDYKVINNAQELKELVDYLEASRKTVISVDCEWHGSNHMDGKLRSLQLGYGNGQAAYIRFRDDKTNYVFDVEYREAGKILSRWLDRPEVKYIGHHISADLPWMHHWLGLEWYRKTLLDTEFGLQCCDENEELGLERLAIKYTDMGRYDWELYMWKRDKENKPLCEDGYGYIPDDILIPYALADVDCVYRSAPIIMADMRRQGVWEYYQQTFGPFTSDVFTWFVLVGLPMDIPLMDDLRDLFQYVTVEFEKEFQNDVFGTIQKKLLDKCRELSENPDLDVAPFEDAMDAWEEGVFKTEKVKALVGQFAAKAVGPQNVKIVKPIIDSLFTINKSFNLYSTDHKKMLLFDTLGLTPVKSTANKSAGMPSVDWETVMEYPPERRKLFTPATDKQTIEILGSQSGEELLQEWLNLNAVGNLRKAFLKEATLDEETGEVTKENGLHKWLCSDNRIHGMFSTTETGRPRSWKPNVLNWPKYASKRVMAGVATLLKQRNEQGVLPEHLKKWLDKKIPGVRSCVRIQEGWCIVESDYQTAEVRGLAYISGDDNLIKLVDEPDPCYVKLTKAGQEATGASTVRVAYPDYLTCADPAYLRKVHKTHDGETVVIDVLDEWVVKDAQGNEVHAKADLHWSLAEMALKLPREVLDEVYRAMGKVGNFSSAYGASGATLERKIESDTKKKPDPGMGDALLRALDERQPTASDYLRDCERIPAEVGTMRAFSGRVRHFHTNKQYRSDSRVSKLLRKKLAAMGRECRNFPMQESVAFSSARACVWLLEFKRKFNLQGYPFSVLYDAITSGCPLHERAIWTKAHTLFMFMKNGHRYDTRLLRYPVDHELNIAWSWAPDDETLKLWKAPEFEPTPPELKHVEDWLDREIEFYTSNPWCSTSRQTLRDLDWHASIPAPNQTNNDHTDAA